MKQRYAILVLSLLALLWAPAAWAQGSCDEAVAIPEAEQLYKTGNFDQVFALLKPCVEKGFGENGKVQAYKLLSMSYLAIDSMAQSQRALVQLLALNPKFEADYAASPRYKALVAYVRESREQVVQVTSVSKKAENILYAPAMVTVLTSKDFEQRGYQTMEQMLHDLSGFDVIRGNGVAYVTFYQRGYRATGSDRTLILIDGVEENDLVSSVVVLNPQYALSDVDRVEIIYGPASTLYGANAFTGVINIITKSFRNKSGPARMVGLTAQTHGGTYNTRYLDGVFSARTPDVAVSITGRIYRSSGRDLSEYPEWDYRPRTASDYGGLLDRTDSLDARKYITNTRLTTLFPNSPLYAVEYFPNSNRVKALRLTPTGATRAAELDNALFGKTIKGNPIAFNDNTFDWMVRGKVEFKDLIISYIDWKTDEAITPWYTNRLALPAGDNPRWVTHDRAASITYTKQFNEKFQILNLASYLLHEIDGSTALPDYKGYYNKKYSFWQLARGIAAKDTSIYNSRVSTQFRNELRLFWSPRFNLDLNGGIELRSGLIQGDYVKSNTDFADESGGVNTQFPGGNNFVTNDLGVYGQVTYRPIVPLKLVMGARLDRNQVRRTKGYGMVANPRLAAIYSRGKLVVKGIYAVAFKDASFLQKYGTTSARLLPNPDLPPERVHNYEGSIHFQATKALATSVVAYYSNYDNAVSGVEVKLPNGKITQQFQPDGSRRIWGLQAEGSYKATPVALWWNATYTNSLDLSDNLPLSDIASYMANAGASYQVGKKLSVYLSGNWVGPRRSGAGTSGSNNPQQEFPSFLVLNSNLTYHNLFEGLSVQLSVNNLLDREYFVPGVREADNFLIASRFPQDRRVISLGAYYTLPTPGAGR